MKNIWLIGPGNIGLDYVKVLQSILDVSDSLTVIGRSPKPNFPVPVYSKGLKSYINKSPNIPEHAIVAVNEHQLYNTTKQLIEYGVKNILIEKPASINIKDLNTLVELSLLKKINLYVGYNRRFYQSIQACKKLIDESKGPININFEFTEWTHTIDLDHYTKEELQHFFLCNSSHILDTVFYLAGKPTTLNSLTSGELEWHPSAALFTGSGVTEKDILFSYSSNWLSAGRWGIEINLPDIKLILRPIEKLQIQQKGSFKIEEMPLNNIDKNYKPGLYKEVESFLGNKVNLCTIKEQLENFKHYYKIANYDSKT